MDKEFENAARLIASSGLSKKDNHHAYIRDALVLAARVWVEMDTRRRVAREDRHRREKVLRHIWEVTQRRKQSEEELAHGIG